ncbi:hypothetical protein HNQ80_003917 [Anaerosolibacter carboniphilus]|uniref:Hook-length control protein FliK n=1 Tax=Anaerosolibacter carboniphilus TaxID=1417629 RepID=A0A841KVX2_9FIRM|nr:hypothetical protein [Anaerosolibacter carboniphilus]MBB6217794.1 hypothetical protein [Anaerosolibacter carboniphilus]
MNIKVRITISNDQFKSIQQVNAEVRALGISQGEIGNFKEGQIITAKIKSILNEIFLLELGNGKSIEAKQNNILGLNLEKGNTYQFIVKTGEDGQIFMKPLLNEDVNIQQSDQGIIKFLEQAGIAPDKDKIQLVKLLLEAEMPVNERMIMEVNKARLQFDRIESLLKGMQDVQTEKGQFLEMDLGQALRELMRNQEQQQSHGESSIQMDGEESHENKFVNTKEMVINSSELENSEKTELLSKMEKNMDAKVEGNIERINIREMDFDKIIFLLKNGLKINLKNATALNDVILRQFPMSQQFEEIIQSLMKDDKTVNLGKNLRETTLKLQDALINRNPEFQEVLKELYAKAEMVKLKLTALDSDQHKDIVKQLENLKNNIDFLGKVNPLQTFLQVPIEIGNSHRNLDLFVVQERGKSKKINPQDVKILVSLDTKNMAFVQALIEIKEKSITCNFRIETEYAKQLIQSHEKKLEDGLTGYGFTNVYFHYAVSQSPIHLINAARSEKSLRHNSIDLKV